MWFSPANEMVKLISGMPAPQLEEDPS
jgi:hypothetical protein